MRILQIHTRYRQLGGEDQVVESEAAGLREKGHEVCQMIAQNPNGRIAAGAALTFAPWNPLMARRSKGVLEEFKPDVAHIHNTWFSMSPSVIYTIKSAGLPVVMTLHNYRLACANALLFRNGTPCTICIGRDPWPAIRYGCYRGSRVQSAFAAATISLHQRRETWTRFVDMFIALTEFQRDLMIEAGIPARSIVVRPGFVDDPGLRASPPSASGIILYVGRLSVEKGVDILLEAWRETDTGNLELVIVGDGPLRGQLSAHLPPRARLLGPVTASEVKDLMLRARAGVMPSLCFEGLPIVLLEFLAAGTGVIGSALGGIGSSISHQDPKWTVPTTPNGLAEAIATLQDDALCDTQGSKGRSTYEHLYTRDASLTTLLGVYAAAQHAARQGVT